MLVKTLDVGLLKLRSCNVKGKTRWRKLEIRNFRQRTGRRVQCKHATTMNKLCKQWTPTGCNQLITPPGTPRHQWYEMIKPLSAATHRGIPNSSKEKIVVLVHHGYCNSTTNKALRLFDPNVVKINICWQCPTRALGFSDLPFTTLTIHHLIYA